MAQTFGFRKNVSKKSFEEVVMDEFKRANSVRARSTSFSNFKAVEVVFFFGPSNNWVVMLILSFGVRSA